MGGKKLHNETAKTVQTPKKTSSPRMKKTPKKKNVEIVLRNTSKIACRSDNYFGLDEKPLKHNTPKDKTKNQKRKE